jgi:hypothetical protein
LQLDIHPSIYLGHLTGMAPGVHSSDVMSTHPENRNRAFSFAQQLRTDVPEETIAHMKVIAPLTSTGPSIRGHVVNDSATMLTVGFPHMVFTGALVQVRIDSKVVFGEARLCTPKGTEYEIEIEKREIY